MNLEVALKSIREFVFEGIVYIGIVKQIRIVTGQLSLNFT